MIISALISFFIFAIIFFSRKFIFQNYRYDAFHAIHDQKVFRVGGLVIFLVTLFFALEASDIELLLLYLFFLPVFILSVIEDFYHNISAKFRFLSILFSSVLYLLYFGPITNINIDFLSNPIILLILTPISLIALTNSFNFIDGVNGLCLLCALCILTSLYFLSDNSLMNNFFIISTPVLVTFFFFNYPFQLFFLGDTGAYMLGFFIASLTIIVFNSNPALLSWNAILLLIYPCTEMLFTFFRRILFKINPFTADTNHLHTLIYTFLMSRLKSSLACNNLVVLIMFPLVFFGPLVCLFVNDFLMVFAAIIIFISLYTLYYLSFKLMTKII